MFLLFDKQRFRLYEIKRRAMLTRKHQKDMKYIAAVATNVCCNNVLPPDELYFCGKIQQSSCRYSTAKRVGGLSVLQYDLFLRALCLPEC